MKVLVLSDSHGNIFNMIQAVEREAPRMVFPPQQRRPGVQLPVLQRHDAVGRPGVVPNAAGV